MTDEAPHIEDTPDSSTPVSDTPEIPWQKRYEDLRPEFDRTKQELAAWDDEQTALQKLAEKFPHLFEEGDDDTEDDDVFQDQDDPAPAAPAPDPRIDWLAAREAQRQFDSDFKEFVGDRSVTGKGREWIEARSRHIADSTNKKWGPDTLKQAVDEYFEHVNEITSAHLEQVTKSKKAPHTPAGGKPGTQVPTLDTHEDRRAWYRQRLAEQQSQQ